MVHLQDLLFIKGRHKIIISIFFFAVVILCFLAKKPTFELFLSNYTLRKLIYACYKLSMKLILINQASSIMREYRCL